MEHDRPTPPADRLDSVMPGYFPQGAANPKDLISIQAMEEML